MNRRRKLVLGGVALAVAAAIVPAMNWETRYEMGQVAFPWQKTRRRLIAARAMLDPGPGMQGGLVVLRTDQSEEEAAAEAKRTRETCDHLATAWTEYVVRCSDARAADRGPIRTEIQGLAVRALGARVGWCTPTPGASPDTETERQVTACLQFFANDACDILDYSPDELATGLMDVLVMKPRQPQPHLQACPFIFH